MIYGLFIATSSLETSLLYSIAAARSPASFSAVCTPLTLACSPLSLSLSLSLCLFLSIWLDLCPSLFEFRSYVIVCVFGVDFDVSKRLLADRTMTVIGTPMFMAPEIFRKVGYSFAVDGTHSFFVIVRL